MEYLSTLQSPIDPHKPSLFELLSEAQLSSLLPPTLRYLLALLTYRHPRYLLRILNSYDEIYALLSLVVEKYYLKTFGGSFTENFYGLKRERVLRIKGGELPRTALTVPAEVRDRLALSRSRGDVWRNLAILVGVPYLKRKLDESYDVHIAPSASLLMSGAGGPRYLDRDSLPSDATLRQRVMHGYKWFLRRVYPSVNAAYYLSVLAFSLAYLFDGTKYSNPFLWMVGTRIRRMGEADYRAIDLAAKRAATAAAAGAVAGRPGQGLSGMLNPRTLYPRLLSSLRLFLPASIFALKFLEWWYASDFSRQLSRQAAEALELPPPIVSGMDLSVRPQVDQKQRTSTRAAVTQSLARTSTQSSPRKPPVSSITFLPILTVPPPSTSDLCPICLHPISNAAACQTGYVFDYKCIFQWIEGEHERQIAWMKGEKMNEWEDEDDEHDDNNNDDDDNDDQRKNDDRETDKGEGGEQIKRREKQSREGKWESGQGRCAVTGRRVLGGTGGLRRVMV